MEDEFSRSEHREPIGLTYDLCATSGSSSSRVDGLSLWDLVAQREVWRANVPGPISGGTLSTAGNLVFQGQSDGKLQAYRATDGKLLWEFEAGIGIMAPPVTYQVDGTQYIAVLAGWGGPELLSNRAAGRGKVGPGKLLSFSLGGTAKLAPYERVVPPVPMPTCFNLPASSLKSKGGRAVIRTVSRDAATEEMW